MPNSDTANLARYIQRFTQQHGYAPTHAEIAAHFGMSTSGVRRRLVRAADAGTISWDPARRRSTRTTNMKARGIEEL